MIYFKAFDLLYLLSSHFLAGRTLPLKPDVSLIHHLTSNQKVIVLMNWLKWVLYNRLAFHFGWNLSIYGSFDKWWTRKIDLKMIWILAFQFSRSPVFFLGFSRSQNNIFFLVLYFNLMCRCAMVHLVQPLFFWVEVEGHEFVSFWEPWKKHRCLVFSETR